MEKAALVCHKWHKAADAACADIKVQLVSAAQLQALQEWVPEHGQAVTSLSVTLQPQHSIFQVPLPPKLCSLRLQGGAFEVPRLCKKAATLTKLVLQQQAWHVAAAPQQSPQLLLLQGIRSLTGMQHLRLSMTHHAVNFPQDAVTHLQWLEAVSGLQRLTHLELIVADSLPAQQGDQQQYLAQLTELQQLKLMVPDTRCLRGIEHLDGLTQLSLIPYNSFPSPLEITPDDSSSIGRLTNLRSLSLEFCRLSASAVAGLTALTALHLGYVQLTSYAAYLQWLEQLQLIVSFSLGTTSTGADEVAPAAYAALTSSPHLQQLNLDWSTPLPRAAWQHIFPAGRERRQLTSLQLPHCSETQRAFDEHPLDAGDVQALARCCPALEQLDGSGVLHIGPGSAA
jgi:hypothetical protein